MHKGNALRTRDQAADAIRELAYGMIDRYPDAARACFTLAAEVRLGQDHGLADLLRAHGARQLRSLFGIEVKAAQTECLN